MSDAPVHAHYTHVWEFCGNARAHEKWIIARGILTSGGSVYGSYIWRAQWAARHINARRNEIYGNHLHSVPDARYAWTLREYTSFRNI